MDSKHLSYFKNLLDDKGILTPDMDLSAYEIGARRDAGKAALVLRPTDTPQLSKIMAYSYESKLHLIPQSGNTGLVGGSVPDESGTQIVLSLERMNSITEIDPINQSAHIGAFISAPQKNATT